MALSHPLVVIQSICTIWTKASRGGVGASARNRTPDALELPALTFPFPEPVFLLHEVIYTERDRFQHPMEKLEQRERDRKSTRLNSRSPDHLVCRLLLE